MVDLENEIVPVLKEKLTVKSCLGVLAALLSIVFMNVLNFS